MPTGEGVAPPAFPSREQVAAIAARPAPTLPADMTHVFVPRWTITGTPAADPLGPDEDHSRATEIGRALVAKRTGAALSPALRCLAHELARFDAQHHGAPNQGLADYVTARCGWPYLLQRSGVFRLDGVSPATSDDAIFDSHGKELIDALDRTLAKEGGRLALASAREGAVFSVAWAWAVPKVTLDAPSLVVRDGVSHLRGSLAGDHVRLQARSNGAGYGVRACASEEASAPSFAFACAAAGKGEPTWVTLSKVDEGHYFGTRVASLLIDATDDASLTWTSPPMPETPPLASVDALPDEVVAPLNDLRRSLGLPAVSLAVAQAKVNAALAPHAADPSDPAGAESSLLGAMAGWELGDDQVMNADAFVSQLAVHSSGEWLGEMLASPVGRAVLLDPAAERIAIGVRRAPDSAIVTSLVTSYTLVHGDAHPELARAFARRLADERAARGAPTIERLRLPAVDASARAIAGGVEPKVAATRAGHAVLGATRSKTYTLAVPTVDPAATPIPAALLAPNVRAFAVAVGHRKKPGAAWTDLVVIWAWSVG